VFNLKTASTLSCIKGKMGFSIYGLQMAVVLVLLGTDTCFCGPLSKLPDSYL